MATVHSPALREAESAPAAGLRSAVRAMSQRDNWSNWSFVLADWLVIAAAITGFVRWPGIPMYLVALVVVGSRMRALANLLHESSHNKLFANRKLNDRVGRILCAAPILISYKEYKKAHVFHHRNLWRGDQDPDAALYRLTHTEGSSVGQLSYSAFVVKHVLLAIIPLMPLRKLYGEIRVDARRGFFAAAGACYAIAAVEFAPRLIVEVTVYCWLVPLFTTCQTISYWAELGEHGGLQSFGWSWGSRNWKGCAFSRWLIGSHSDDPYHLLHHWFPSVPHYRLRYLDSVCRLAWPEYSLRRPCSGFFVGRRRAGATVLRDIWSGSDEQWHRKLPDMPLVVRQSRRGDQ